ncbi:MAG: two-component regulator propeller domain-containing protein [Saprospiraceae bacterium]
MLIAKYPDLILQHIKALLHICILLSVCPLLWGQHDNITFEHFTNDQGLSSPVTIIAQDHYGFLWLGTTDGLNRFDGRNFIVYRNIPGDSTSLTNNIINAICIDSTGRVWVATNGGLCYYNFSDNSFHQIEFNDTIEKIDRHRVHAATISHDGGIWFATKTHLHKWYNDKTVKNYSLPLAQNLSIRYLFENDDGLLWIGTNDALMVFNEAQNTCVTTKINSPFSIEKKLAATVHPIVHYDDNHLLIGSWYAGLQKVSLTQDSLHADLYPDVEGLDSRKHIVTGIAKGSSGTWWIGTYGTGLSIFDSRTGTFTDHFQHDAADSKSLSDDYVNAVFVDASNILWIGTSTGLDKYDILTQQFKTVSIPASPDEFSVYRLPYTITEDIRDPKYLWICVGGAGLFHFNTLTREFRLYHYEEKDPNSLPDNTVYTLYYDHLGKIWIGSRTGLYLFDEEHERFVHAPGPLNTMPGGTHIILEDKNNIMWFATYSGGVYSYDEALNKLTAYAYDERNHNSLPDNRVFSMMEDHLGLIWIGTQNKGLCSLNPISGQFTFFEYDKKNPASIPDNGIYDVYEDEQHHIWIATENGFAEMDDQHHIITNYSTNDGLCNNDIFSITTDHQHHLWLSTNNGISKFDPENHVFKNYFIHDGLPTNSISGSVCCAHDGTLYFGTSGMITFCKPERMKMNRHVPPVVITNFKIFDHQAPVMRNGEMLQPVHLSYKENMITFDFAALNFTNAMLNQYAYKLEGFNEDWIRCGNKQSATFTNLDGGEYTFRVKAANNDGVWNEIGTEVLLIVDPPFWKTWWFYLLFVLSIAGMLYALYRFRINQFLKLQQIRMRISRDLHDDIGSTLSSINMMSSMAGAVNGSQKKSSDLFQTISSASRQALELMNDIVWSINPKNDKMEMIIIRMRQYASETLEAAQIHFTIEMDDACKQIILPIEKRKDFYLIFKEAINNLAKYSNANKVNIRLHYVSRLLALIISDDGRGFDPVADHKGNGLKNMKARAEMLKGELSIISKHGAGTTIALNIPVTP